MSFKAAIVQKPPVALDLAASLDRAASWIAEAAAGGARLILFPETFLPGYPSWVWRLRPGPDIRLGNEIHARLRRNAVDLSGEALDPVREAAARHRTVVVIGLHEIDAAYSGSTLFNTVAVIGEDGRILHRHRKLVPTNPERMVWGAGDASGLRVVETPLGRLGVLICWENYMPLARFALYAQNIEIYLAPTWDCGETWLASMRHIAKEGGCWVLATGTAMQAGDLPADFPGRDRLYPDPEEWLCRGDAVVIRPFGGILAGPLACEKEILYAEVDPEAARRARKTLDVAGHYGRPDVFRLEVDRRPRPPVQFVDSGDTTTQE